MDSERYEAALKSLQDEPKPLEYEPETYDSVYERLCGHVELDLLTIQEANQIMEEYRKMYGW